MNQSGICRKELLSELELMSLYSDITDQDHTGEQNTVKQNTWEQPTVEQYKVEQLSSVAVEPVVKETVTVEQPVTVEPLSHRSEQMKPVFMHGCFDYVFSSQPVLKIVSPGHKEVQQEGLRRHSLKRKINVSEPNYRFKLFSFVSIYQWLCFRLGSYDALSSDDSQSLSLSQSQEIPLSQSSNWSTKSENKSSILKIKTKQKAQDVQKIRDLFQDLGHSFPDSLNAALDPNVRPILQHL